MKEIILKGIIGLDVFAEDIREQLPAGKEQVRLDINSPGGDVFEAFEIYNLLKAYPGRVTARVTGLAASAAADLFFGADDREWFSHSAVMYHRAWTVVLGNARELREEADILDSLDRIRIADFSRVTGRDPARAETEFTDETWLVGDAQIRAAGIAGTLVDGESPGPETGGDDKRTVALMRDRIREARAASMRAHTNSIRREKIAAMLETEPPAGKQVPADINKPQGGDVVNFEEFLAQNPGAEEEVFAWAKTRTGPGAIEAAIDAAIRKAEREAESERILKLLALSGAAVPEDAKQAIAEWTSPEAFAVRVLEKQREIEARFRTANDLHPGTVEQTPGGQAGMKPAGTAEDAATAESVKALARELGRR